MRHYDVQLIGGMVLHMGKIAEMRTGEGKTLVATLPVYLNALEGKGVHVVTVNDYLARRDAGWMGKLYTWLGLSVGVVYPGMPHSDKHEAYAATSPTAPTTRSASTTCATTWRCRRTTASSAACNYAIVDEVDSILIDEARTPLIISGPADESPELYIKVNRIVPQLTRQKKEEGEGDYWVDEKGKQVHLSEAGQEHAEAAAARGRHHRRRRQPVRLAQHPRRAPPQRRPARAWHLPARRRLHRARRRSHHRRRVHRPHAAGPALVRRPAPGGRGEGRRAGAAREPDARVASPSRTCSACTRSCPA